MEAVRKLEQVLINMKDLYIPYIQEAKISKVVQEKVLQSKLLLNVNIQDITYIQIIIHILHRFILTTTSPE
jgi:hypothetical protein